MIYTDKVGHLISSTSLEELHQFAKTIGLRRSWFQDKPRYPHYDLTTERAKQRAANAGAQVIDSKRLIKILRTVSYIQEVPHATP